MVAVPVLEAGVERRGGSSPLIPTNHMMNDEEIILWDKFAGQALTGLIGLHTFSALSYVENKNSGLNKVLVGLAYDIAEEMIIERRMLLEDNYDEQVTHYRTQLKKQGG